MRQIISALLGAIALSIACVPGVLAADMPMKAPVAAPYNNWTGFYVGLNAGGGWGHSNDPTSAPTTGYFSAASTTAVNYAGAQSTNTSGFTGGLQAGYNWQWANIVAGIEADFDYFGQKGSSSTSGVYPGSLLTSSSFTINSSVSTNWLFTARPRLGMVVANNWLFYGTGGLAVTQVKANWSFTDNCNTGVCSVGTFSPPTSESTSASATKAGWVVGGGVESALPGKLSLGVEYLYVNFGSISATNSNFTSGTPAPGGQTQAFNHSADLTVNIVRVRLNKQF
jgi:outer membrane immunogenic protein